jgi:hypothetical protein
MVRNLSDTIGRQGGKMKYYRRTDIFICESVQEQEKIYGKIREYLDRNEEDKCTCNIIGKKDILEKLKDPRHKELKGLRFACITSKTRSVILTELFDRGIPMLFFNLGNSDLFEDFRTTYKLDKSHIERMIYEIDHLHEIRGAINWVHTYYYHLREQDQKRVNEMRQHTNQIENYLSTDGIIQE